MIVAKVGVGQTAVGHRQAVRSDVMAHHQPSFWISASTHTAEQVPITAEQVPIAGAGLASGSGRACRGIVLTLAAVTALVPLAASGSPADEPPVVEQSTLKEPPVQPSTPSVPTVRADPRIELFSVIFRLAGHFEFDRGSVESYTRDMDEWFTPHATHPAVKLAKKLKRDDRIGRDAVISLAVHMDDGFGPEARVPLNAAFSRLDERWQPAEARKFLKLAADFAKETKFNEFISNHAALYELAADRLRQRVEQDIHVEWCDRFFGSRPASRLVVVPGLLNQDYDFDAVFQDADGRQELYCIIGVQKTTPSGNPCFAGDDLPRIGRRILHWYVDPLVDRHEAALHSAGESIYPHVKGEMKYSSVRSWKGMMSESLTQSCFARYVLDNPFEGPSKGYGSQILQDWLRRDVSDSDAHAALRRDVEHPGAGEYHEAIGWATGSGVIWASAFDGLLDEYEVDRRTWPTLESFMPRVVAWFDEYAAGGEAERTAYREKHAPKLVATVPAHEATGVDPATKVIKITFDGDMSDVVWKTVVLKVSQLPYVVKLDPPSYDDTGRVMTVPVSLKPKSQYTLMLMAEQKAAFRERFGLASEFLLVRFETGEAAGEPAANDE